MLSIRLARFGKKKQPSYRIIVCQKHKDPFGDYIANLGHINYFGGKKNVTLDAEAAKQWLENGAQPSATVHNLFVSEGIIKDSKKRPDGIRKKKKDEAKEKEQAEAAKAESSDAPAETPTETASEEAPAADAADEPQEEKVEEKPAEEPEAPAEKEERKSE